MYSVHVLLNVFILFLYLWILYSYFDFLSLLLPFLFDPLENSFCLFCFVTSLRLLGLPEEGGVLLKTNASCPGCRPNGCSAAGNKTLTVRLGWTTPPSCALALFSLSPCHDTEAARAREISFPFKPAHTPLRRSHTPSHLLSHSPSHSYSYSPLLPLIKQMDGACAEPSRRIAARQLRRGCISVFHRNVQPEIQLTAWLSFLLTGEKIPSSCWA